MDEDQYLDSYWEDRNEMYDFPDDEPDYDDDPDWDEDGDIGDEPPGMTDVEADADTLASAGYGTDEDYGYFGPDSDE